MDNRNDNNRVERVDGVSVVVPTYNRPDYLERLLASIAKQTREVDEVIIVNDCSSNLSEYEEVIKKYREKLNLRHIVARQNQGAPMCRNQGIKEARYKYIALTDDDDEWTDNKIELQYNRISQNDIGLLYTHGISVNDKNEILYEFKGVGNGRDIKSLLRECFIPSSSVMVTYEAISKAGMFDPLMPSCQDWDMWTRIIAAGYSYDYIDSKLLIYHKHEGESIGASPKARLGYKRFYRKHLLKYIKCFLFTKEYRKCLHALKLAILVN